MYVAVIIHDMKIKNKLRMGAERKLIEFGAGKILKRLDEMLTEVINGAFEESRYDETELSRLESRWKQYLTTSRMSTEKTNQEREKIQDGTVGNGSIGSETCARFGKTFGRTGS